VVTALTPSEIQARIVAATAWKPITPGTSLFQCHHVSHGESDASVLPGPDRSECVSARDAGTGGCQ
jgi:hypothetical protein